MQQQSKNPSVRFGRNFTAFYLSAGLLVCCALGLACSALILSGCGGAPNAGSTTGPEFSASKEVPTNVFDEAAAVKFGDCAIDVSHTAQGYIGARGTSPTKLKLQVSLGNQSYNYDIPPDGKPFFVPVNMGDGNYNIRVMQNTTGDQYSQIGSVEKKIALDNEFMPFLSPNVFSNFTPQSQATKKAAELAAGAKNSGDVVRAIYSWIVENIKYDNTKAEALAAGTGYVPNPDETLASRTGICFDYAALAGAMFRSLGIPCKVITGYVSPDNIYHAWNLIYIDGEWVTAEVSVKPNEWCQIDTTFAAAGQGNANVGDGIEYTKRYTY